MVNIVSFNRAQRPYRGGVNKNCIENPLRGGARSAAIKNSLEEK